MDNFLMTDDSNSDSCLEKAKQHIKASSPALKNISVKQKDSDETGQQERLLGMFSFLG